MNLLNFHDENPLVEEDGDDVMELDDDMELEDEYDNSDDEHSNVDEADEDPSDDEDEAQPPEQVVGLVLEALIAQELELRKGQANDALEKLHLALAHTSLLWRTKVQTANTTKK